MTSLDYPIAECTLGNGLRVIISPDHAAPAVAVNLWYDVGSRHEDAGKTGFAHLFEHVMFQGSAHVKPGEHIAVMQSAGASVNATTWFDRTNYFEALPLGGLELALWLEADRMGTLLDALTQENLDTQREVVKEEKRQRYDNVPYGDVMERLVRLTFPAGHPYAHTTIGSMADLDAASLDDAHAFFRAHYMPNNAVLTLVGDVEPNQGFALTERYFGGLSAQSHVPVEPVAALGPISGSPREESSADVPADAVYLTWRLPQLGTPEFDAVDLALSVLGQGQTSRLHQHLVRTAELAEGAGASSLGLIGGNSFGFVSARCRDGVSPEKIEAELVNDLQVLTHQGPTDDELSLAKAQFERSWLQVMARVEARADQISSFATLQDDPELINKRIAQIEAIDAAAITQAAQEHLGVGDQATLVYRTSDNARLAA